MVQKALFIYLCYIIKDLIKLSVVVITFNEEKNLARCLKSVEAIADEIVVIDSFSTDKTKEIALKYNAKFIEHSFEGHIEQKNWAITQASFPHILSLDADEALDSNLVESIKNIKSNWTADGYKMNRLTNYCGKWIRHCGWYPDQKLRLWDSRKGKWGGINPHDEYKMENGASIQHLKGDILHYSFYTIKQHIDTVNSFSEIGAQQYFKKGKKGGFLNIIMNPILKFVGAYFFRLGFLDGYYGFVVCAISAHAKFLKYVKLRELVKNDRQSINS